MEERSVLPHSTISTRSRNIGRAEPRSSRKAWSIWLSTRRMRTLHQRRRSPSTNSWSGYHPKWPSSCEWSDPLPMSIVRAESTSRLFLADYLDGEQTRACSVFSADSFLCSVILLFMPRSVPDRLHPSLLTTSPRYGTWPRTVGHTAARRVPYASLTPMLDCHTHIPMFVSTKKHFFQFNLQSTYHSSDLLRITARNSEIVRVPRRNLVDKIDENPYSSEPLTSPTDLCWYATHTTRRRDPMHAFSSRGKFDRHVSGAQREVPFCRPQTPAS
jgi:hypothetical protein